jgi:phenylalanyl-tRNA synthetase alpha chain
MLYQTPQIADAANKLREEFNALEDKKSILKSSVLKTLYERIKDLPADQKAAFGKEVNQLRQELEQWIEQANDKSAEVEPLDVTAPFDKNVEPEKRPGLLPADQGSKHPITSELTNIRDIFAQMGFTAVESPELDDDFHMFESLNFPADHPARDHYDTFMTDEGLIAPAHTSTMQNRVLRRFGSNLQEGKAIAVIIPGRVFRNEDLDVRHEHTFYQLEGVYVDKGVNAGHLIATLKVFLEAYYEQKLEVKTQPFYFPFTEPSFEFALSCPFCKKAGCAICKHTGWIELLGCGMIHPNVLRMADIDPAIYTGFAWGGGVERLVMMKHGIEDVRLFESANLKFLRQFRSLL